MTDFTNLKSDLVDGVDDIECLITEVEAEFDVAVTGSNRHNPFLVSELVEELRLLLVVKEELDDIKTRLAALEA